MSIPPDEEIKRRLAETLPEHHMLAASIVSVLTPLCSDVERKDLTVRPPELGVSLAYLCVSAYKTYHALRRTCDTTEPWGQQGLVFTRMIFENYITASWIAQNPQERAVRFLMFEHIATVQGAAVQKQIDATFFDIAVALPSQQLRGIRHKFVEAARVLGMNIEKLKQCRSQEELRKQMVKLKWTEKGARAMAEDLSDSQSLEDYYTLYILSNSVVHATAFGARINLTDDSAFRFEPDPVLAVCALGYGSEYLLKLGQLLNGQFCLGYGAQLTAMREQLKRLHDGIGGSEK